MIAFNENRSATPPPGHPGFGAIAPTDDLSLTETIRNALRKSFTTFPTVGRIDRTFQSARIASERFRTL